MRYRTRSNIAALGVFAGLILSGIASWTAFLWAFFTVL